MASKIRSLGILAAVVVVLLIGVLWLALSFSGVGVNSEIGAGGLPLYVDDLSAIPQSVAEDAAELAGGLFGDYQERCDDFANQLLALYSEAKDRDFIIFFNPGGWGWNLVENSPGWRSIFTGIESELDSSGYTSLLLDYRRTVGTVQGCLNELAEMRNGYATKAKQLASRVDFLTAHIPELKIIVAGESNGTVICDMVMNILRDNPQVYSIQTGTPFWHTAITLDRILVVNDNGITPDSFSQGDFLTIIGANLRAFLGLSQSEGDSGKILNYVGAPGHDYWWQYPEVHSQIVDFFDKNLGIK